MDDTKFLDFLKLLIMICHQLNIDVKDSKEKQIIEADKHNSARIFQELSDQIATMRKTLDLSVSCKKKGQRVQAISAKDETRGPVRYFENNNEGYVKIRKTAEEKVVSILSDQENAVKVGPFFVN